MQRTTLLAILLFLALPGLASAHGVSPLHAAPLQVGPYALEAGFFHWPVRSEQRADLLLTPQSASYQRRQLAIEAWLIPLPGTPGEPVRLQVAADSDSANAYSLGLYPVVKGDWELKLMVRGPEGAGEARLAIPVSGPPNIPLWLGWSIGLTPALGLLVFAARQRRRLAAPAS